MTVSEPRGGAGSFRKGEDGDEDKDEVDKVESETVVESWGYQRHQPPGPEERNTQHQHLESNQGCYLELSLMVTQRG